MHATRHGPGSRRERGRDAARWPFLVEEGPQADTTGPDGYPNMITTVNGVHSAAMW